MELNNLKSLWQNAGGVDKSEAELHRMTKVTHHPSLKKIRTKLLVETIGLTLFLFIYNDWFDGHNKPVYVNVLLVCSVLLYIFNDVIGYIATAKPIRGANLKISIEKYFVRIKRLSVFSLITSFLYGLCLILFFSSSINFTQEKYLILSGIIAFLLLMTYLSYRIWHRWIESLKAQVKDFILEESH